MTQETTACYLRVSSSKQAEHNSVSAQRHALEGWLKSKGVEPSSVLWYADEGVTGGHMNRPAWKELRARIQAGEVRHLVAFDLSRIGRSVSDVAGFIEEAIELGVKVEMVNGGFDLSTIWGKALAQMCAVFAELDRSFKKEAARAGIRARIAAGKPWGNPGRVPKADWLEAADRIRRGESTPTKEGKRLGVNRDYAFKRFRAMLRGT